LDEHRQIMRESLQALAHDPIQIGIRPAFLAGKRALLFMQRGLRAISCFISITSRSRKRAASAVSPGSLAAFAAATGDSVHLAGDGSAGRALLAQGLRDLCTRGSTC
jgi:hypothetical protein